MKNVKIELHSNPNDAEHFFANVFGNEEDVAQMIFAYLTYKPNVLKKVFKKISDEAYRGNDNE